jgi:hypothetical protein
MPLLPVCAVRRAFSLLPLVGLIWLLPAAAQAQDSTLTRLIRRSQLALTPGNGAQFSGPGWDKIRADVQQSQFVLLGEGHGMAQIPVFAAAVAQVLKPALFATEVDPYIAQRVTQLVAQPGLAPAAAYLQRYPEALCFYDWAEELELVRALRAQQAQVLGLDQVYGSTAAPFYAQLAGLVKNKPAKAYLQRRAAAYEQQTQAFEKLGNDDWVMDKQASGTVDSLLLLTKGESPIAQKMAQDYVASYHIYQAHQRNANGHQERLNMLKRNLLQALPTYQTTASPAAPKMLFKFGSNHLARGLSPLMKGEYYDLGNLVQNLADMQGQKSLHVYVIGKQGARAEADNLNFPAKNAVTYTAAENVALRPFLEQVTGPAWVAFDLRPTRQALTTGKLQVAEKLRRIIQGYDYLVVIPETTASHLIK